MRWSSIGLEIDTEQLLAAVRERFGAGKVSGHLMGARDGPSAKLPDDLGTVSFDGLQRWNKIQVSRSPGKMVALAGVVLALLGLLGSLFIRPRRLWVRARRQDDGTTLVEVARLDRSSAGDPEDGAAEMDDVVAALQGRTTKEDES